jgi:hypothetical protein
LIRPAAGPTGIIVAASPPRPQEEFAARAGWAIPLPSIGCPSGFTASGSQDTDLGKVPREGAAKSGAVYPSFVPTDPVLARLIDAWPTLPPHIKNAVLALIESTGYEG